MPTSCTSLRILLSYQNKIKTKHLFDLNELNWTIHPDSFNQFHNVSYCLCSTHDLSASACCPLPYCHTFPIKWQNLWHHALNITLRSILTMNPANNLTLCSQPFCSLNFCLSFLGFPISTQIFRFSSTVSSFGVEDVLLFYVWAVCGKPGSGLSPWWGFPRTNKDSKRIKGNSWEK